MTRSEEDVEAVRATGQYSWSTRVGVGGWRRVKALFTAKMQRYAEFGGGVMPHGAALIDRGTGGPAA
jgi:hypothetical protein